MGYLSEKMLRAMGFAEIGRNVMISDKAAIYGADQMRLGDNSRIDDFCVVSGKVDIGKNVHFAPFCLVAGGVPGITFGDFSGLAYGVKIFAQSDDYSGRTMTNPTVPKAWKEEHFAKVQVGRHVIVGAGSVICPGVSLGDGTAIGALSLVLQSTDAWCIYVGNPARKLRARQTELLALESQYLATANENG